MFSEAMPPSLLRKIVEDEEARKRRSGAHEAAQETPRPPRRTHEEEVLLEPATEEALALETAVQPAPRQAAKTPPSADALAPTLPYVAPRRKELFTSDMSRSVPEHNVAVMNYLAAALPAEIKMSAPQLAPELIPLLIEKVRVAMLGTKEKPKFSAVQPDAVGSDVVEAIMEMAPDFPKEQIAAVRQRIENIAEKIPAPISQRAENLIQRAQVLHQMLERAETKISGSALPPAELKNLLAADFDRSALPADQREAVFAVMEKQELQKDLAASPKAISEALHSLQADIIELKRDRQLLADTAARDQNPQAQITLLTLLDHNIQHAEYVLKEAVRQGHRLPGSEPVAGS